MSLSRLLLLSCACLAWSQGAKAQTDSRNGARSRPPMPDFARPPPRSERQAEATVAQASRRPEDTGRVAAIEIEGPQGVADAVPPPAWQPPSDSLAGLSLDHRRGEPLDAAWVRRQFERNAAAGGSAARAIALVQLVNRAFLLAGFVNSGLRVAPADPARPGLLRLSLVHGRLVAPAGGQAISLRWTGGRSLGLSPSYVSNRMKAARRIPLSAAAIERDFRLLAEDPALRTIDARLRPGTAPGEASLELDVRPRERADFYVEAANDRSPSVGGERIAAGGSFRNLVESGDLLSGEAGTTRGLADASLAYSVPLFGPSASLSLRGGLDDAAVVDAPLLPLDIKTREHFAEGMLTRRLIADPLTPAGEGRWSPSRILSVGLGLAWREQRSFLLGRPFSFAPGSVDGHSEYLAGRLVSDLVIRGVDQVFAFALTGTIGIDGTRADQPLVLDPNRHFMALLGQLDYARRLSRRGLELRARLAGQWSDGTLYSGERLSIGGATTVRGYRESLVLADRGLIGSIELTRPFSLSGDKGGGFDWGAFSAGLFVDAARAWNARGPAPVPGRLASIGPSLAWRPSEGLSLSLDWGIALVHAGVTGSRDLQDDGFHFSLTVRPFRLLRRTR